MEQGGYYDGDLAPHSSNENSAIYSFINTNTPRFSLVQLDPIGMGKTSTVYKVRDTRNNKCFAAKVCLNNLSTAWEEEIHMEAWAALGKKDVIVEIFGRYEVNGGKWVVYVMTLLDPLPQSALYGDSMRLCLSLFHKAGFSHGDIHVGNFMIDPATDTVRLIDFGLSFNYNKKATFTPPIPRGKRDTLHVNWSWLTARIDWSDLQAIRCADYLIDTQKLEDIIETLPID